MAQLIPKKAFGHLLLILIALFLLLASLAVAQTKPVVPTLTPQYSEAIAFDVSPPVRSLTRISPGLPDLRGQLLEIRPERGPVAKDRGYSGDGARQIFSGVAAIPSPLVNFEGLSNQDNFQILGGRVNPPDPNGVVGPDHYVEEINLVWAVYDKVGNKLAGPFDLGSLWQGFPITDCAGNAGDPIALYDQFTDRWLLSQFTSAGPTYYNCVAISTSGDPTGTYYRYAFTAGEFFPDYPKYGLWRDTFVLTSRDFGPMGEYGISVYGLEKSKMIAGMPFVRQVKYFLDSSVVPINLMGDGLLPPDIDGATQPPASMPAPIVGTQDDDGPYGATFDALNIWNFAITWPAYKAVPISSFTLATQLSVAPFDSIFPCAPGARDCLPQPGITNPDQYLDHLGYRQRPTFRLAYRNFGSYEAMVTNQSVEAEPSISGVRWYEIRRTGGNYSVFQQGTYVPDDGVHRWMGSIAMDHQGNMLLGYSVVNGSTVYPGIRYTGRMAGDPLGQMTLGEGTVVDGTGVQTTTNSRWGDYTAMTLDPTDDCTFWYVNEYYTLEGQHSSSAGWQTRVASVQLPGCVQAH